MIFIDCAVYGSVFQSDMDCIQYHYRKYDAYFSLFLLSSRANHQQPQSYRSVVELKNERWQTIHFLVQYRTENTLVVSYIHV